jgi:chromosome segregation ATPase
MSEVSERMDRLQAKLGKLSSKMMALQGQNEQLSHELGLAKNRFSEQASQITALSQENERIKLAKMVVTASGDKAAMKFRVNEMVKEIDKCIALLNR